MTEETRSQATRRLALKLALLFFSCALALVLGEVATRVLRLAPEVNRLEISSKYGAFRASDNRILKYEPKPGSGDINSYGIRDSDYARAKPKDTYRIVVIGDSIAYGFCTSDEALRREDTFAKVLERSFAAQPVAGYGRIEVINLAVSGYDTIQEAEFLKQKGLALQPDLVLLSYCLNDTWDASLELRSFRRMGDPNATAPNSALLAGLFRHSALVRFVWQRSAMAKKRVERGQSDVDKPALGFDAIRRMADDAGFGVLVVVFPLFSEDFRQYKSRADHEAAAEKARARKFSVLDLLEPFTQASGGDPRALQGRCKREHPDERGHAVAAAEIETFLRAHVLTPK